MISDSTDRLTLAQTKTLQQGLASLAQILAPDRCEVELGYAEWTNLGDGIETIFSDAGCAIETKQLRNPENALPSRFTVWANAKALSAIAAAFSDAHLVLRGEPRDSAKITVILPRTWSTPQVEAEPHGSTPPVSEVCDVPARTAVQPCADPVAMTPEEIWEEGKSRSVYEQADSAWKKYENACVDWTKPLKEIHEKGDVLEVYLAAGRSGLLTVAARVRTEDYPEIKLAKQGAPIKVRGRILFVQLAYIALKDAVVTVGPSQ